MTLKKRQERGGTREEEEEEERSSWRSKRQYYLLFWITDFRFLVESGVKRCMYVHRAGQKQKASGNAAPEQIPEDGFGRIGGF